MVQNEEARTAENRGKNITSHSPGETRAKTSKTEAVQNTEFLQCSH